MKIKNWIIIGAGLVTGTILGYTYWYYVGCLSGTCPITASPVNSTIYGALLGTSLANLFITWPNQQSKQASKNS